MRRAVTALPVAQCAETDPEGCCESLLRKPGLLPHFLHIDLGGLVNLDIGPFSFLVINGLFHPFFYAFEDVAHISLPLFILSCRLDQNAGKSCQLLPFALRKVVLSIFPIERQKVKWHFFIVEKINDPYPAALLFAFPGPA